MARVLRYLSLAAYSLVPFAYCILPCVLDHKHTGEWRHMLSSIHSMDAHRVARSRYRVYVELYDVVVWSVDESVAV